MAWYRGVVVDTADPDDEGRVRLQVPQLFGTSVTNWATPMDFYLNTVYIPSVGEQVWVSFEGADFTYPIYLPSYSKSATDGRVLKAVSASAALKSNPKITVSAV